jgi:hypothetical protein
VGVLPEELGPPQPLSLVNEREPMRMRSRVRATLLELIVPEVVEGPEATNGVESFTAEEAEIAVLPVQLTAP